MTNEDAQTRIPPTFVNCDRDWSGVSVGLRAVLFWRATRFGCWAAQNAQEM